MQPTRISCLDLNDARGLKCLAQSIENKLTHMPMNNPRLPVPIPVLSNYLAGGILDLLRWWVDHQVPYTPERRDDIFQTLVMPGLRSVLVGNKANAE
jgi:hypothetical protein